MTYLTLLIAIIMMIIGIVVDDKLCVARER